MDFSDMFNGFDRIRVNGCGLIHCPTDWDLGPARSREWKDLDLWLLLKGYGSVYEGDKLHKIEAGSCLFMQGGNDYQFYQDMDNRFYHYWIHFDLLDDAGKPLPYNEADLPAFYRRFTRLEFVSGLFIRFLECFQKKDFSGQNLWMQSILAEIKREDSKKEFIKQSPHAGAISSLCAEIREFPHRDYRIDVISEKMSLNPSYFCRLFTELVGISPKKFIIGTRMEYARHLLTDSQMTITAIAEKTGYNDVHFFIRHFKKIHGVPPGYYRNS